MTPAVPHTREPGALPRMVRGGERRPGLRKRRTRRWRFLRDPYLSYTAALVPIALLVALASEAPADLPAVVALSVLFVGIQGLLGMVPGRRRLLTPLGWSFLRLSVALLFVGGLVDLVGGPSKPMVALYLPIVVAAAAIGTVQAVVIGAVASIIYLAPELARMGDPTDLAVRGIALAGVSVLVAGGTRRLVTTVERRSRQLRTAALAERRRSRQIAGMETISRLLMAGGPRSELLDQVLGILVDRFDYHYVSIYLWDGELLRLGAQRGYTQPRETFDGTVGVIGRVMRTRQLAYVPDAGRDPDYLAVFGEVVSEICAPLLIDGEFLGILNVEAREPLDLTDRDLVATLADRVSTVVALGRDRQALAEREAVFRSLHGFAEATSGTLDVDRLADALVAAARTVVRADIVALTILDRATGTYRVRAVTDVDAEHLGGEVRPGESLAGRAIRDRQVVIDDQFHTRLFPTAYRDLVEEERALLGAGIPLIRDGVVVGALSLVRNDPTDAFRSIDREAMELMAGHAALTVANAFLHADLGELAIRDPLTGLYNRRYFDETLDRMLAAWVRLPADQRRSLAAITFDLDEFGDFNKRHGHQVGDAVLRTFADVLRTRFRASDLVARLGGEEFVVVLEGATREDAVRVADEVRAALGERAVANDNGERLTVTASAGCAALDVTAPTREQLLRTADVGLFMAKRAGRNRSVAA